ncbi:MAG: dTDP-4-dehydrorhamnose reductase [Lentisphaerae bacterium]|nr:dTDP-4-dehydrorhamnose reductase [Lentisphaerota bacterium]
MREKILLTGGNGMLGRTICRILGDRFEIVPTDLPDVDITKVDSLVNAVEKYSPVAVIHCAAMTAVDKCESEKEKAFLLNQQGTANVAEVCRHAGIRLLAISTDYVFDGSSAEAYSEYDPANGGNTVYGQSKFAGEEAIRKIYPENSLICRISWLYGFGGPSFLHTMLALADGRHPELKVVADQVGNPTSAVSVAHKLGELLQHPEINGTIHLTCEGEASWYEFAVEIFRQCRINQQVKACSTTEFPRPAPRPANSRLRKDKLREYGLSPMPHWRDALAEFISLEFAARK